MKIDRYPEFVENSTSESLDRYRRAIFAQVEALIPHNANIPIPEDELLNFQTTIFALLNGLAEEIIDLANELGDIKHE